MRILINRTQEEAQKYALLSTCAIVSLAEVGNLASEDVIVLVEDSDFEQLLKTVVGHTVPVIAVTTKDSKCYQQALSLIHPCAVIYYEDGKILSSQKTFAEASGLSVKTLEAICRYAMENKLYPDIFVWKPQEDVVSFETKQEQSRNQVASQTTSAKLQSKAYTPAQTDLRTYINSTDRIIAVFKTSPSADSSSIASKLAKQLNTVHLNISTNTPQKQSPYYAYSDGNLVEYNSSMMPGQYLVVEVDAQIPEALELIYNAAFKIVHVAGNPNESLEPLRAWTGSGFKLDAVIPNQVRDIPSYSTEFPSYSVEDFRKLL